MLERLPNGWSKKAVKRASGVAKGKWDTFLITPDRKILRTAVELKLYIAKSGAVIDANLVNFSLPKRIVKVDRKLSSLADRQDKSDAESEAQRAKKSADLSGEQLPTPVKVQGQFVI